MQEVLEEWLTAETGQKVHIRVPQKGQKEKLVELAAKNAQLVLEKGQRKDQERRRPDDRRGKRD